MPSAPRTIGRVQGPSQFLSLFASWYFLRHPVVILRAYATYARVCADMFSIIFLLRTLLAPWKNIVDAYPKNGFDLNLLLQTLTFNLVTRAIGAVIRLGAILVAVILQAVLLAGFLAYLIMWVLFPLLIIAAGVYLFAFA